MNNVYTQTLSSDYVLVVDPQMDFGEILIAGPLLILLALLALEILMELRNAYNERNRPTN